MSFYNALLFAAPPSGAGGSSGGSSMVSIMTFGLLFVVMYFVLIRPQSKRKKEHQQKLSQMSVGDSVVSIGGIHGVITHVNQAYVIVKIDENVKIKFNKEAVGTIVSKAADAPAKAADASNAKASTNTDAKNKTSKKTAKTT